MKDDHLMEKVQVNIALHSFTNEISRYGYDLFSYI